MAGLGARGGGGSRGTEVRKRAEDPLAPPSRRLASCTEQAPRREGRVLCDVRTQPIGSHAAVCPKVRPRLRASAFRSAEVTGSLSQALGRVSEKGQVRARRRN